MNILSTIKNYIIAFFIFIAAIILAFIFGILKGIKKSEINNTNEAVSKQKEIIKTKNEIKTKIVAMPKSGTNSPSYELRKHYTADD